VRVTKLTVQLSAVELKLGLFLAGHTIAMVTYCIQKIKTCSSMIGQVFDTMIVASTHEERLFIKI